MPNRIVQGGAKIFQEGRSPSWSRAWFTVCGTLYSLLALSALSDNASFLLLSQPRLLHEFPVLLSPGRFQDALHQAK